jgi:hypothetical protein
MDKWFNLNTSKIPIITKDNVCVNQIEKITGKRTIVVVLFMGVQFK